VEDKRLDAAIMDHEKQLESLRKDLEECKSKCDKGPGAGFSSNKPEMADAGRHRPQFFTVDQWTSFNMKDSQGADYPVATKWLKGALKLAQEAGEPMKHIAEVLEGGNVDMRWPGSAMAFQIWVKDEHRELVNETAAFLLTKIADVRLHIKGLKPKRIRGQIPDSLLAKQKLAGVVHAGITQALVGLNKAGEDQWIPNVFFGGSFSIMVGKVTKDTPIERFTRPTHGSVLLGTVCDGPRVVWKEEAVVKTLGVSGDAVEALGVSARRG